MANMEATQVKLETSFEEAVMNFDCDEDKNIADIKYHPTLPFICNDEQATAQSDSVSESMVTCLKDFDTVFNNVCEQNAQINTLTFNVGDKDELGASSLETLCNNQANADIDTWKNIYENFAQINEFKNTFVVNTDDLDEISQIEDKTIRNDVEIVSDTKYIVPTDLTEHKAQIVETQTNYNNFYTNIIENYNDWAKVDEEFANDRKIGRKKRHINRERICKRDSCKSVTRKQCNENLNLKRNVPLELYNIESEISITKDDENLRENAKILKNEISDIISISSDESIEKIEFESDGYNSDDFEFINEIEATKDIPQFDNFIELLTNMPDVKETNVKELYPEDMIINDYFESLYPIPDANEPDVNYRENHTIPLGEDYINLFGGNYTPYPMYSFENKSTRSSAGMNVERGVGFDLEMFIDDSTAEERSEAKESERKILSMYYVENRNRRQRRR